MKKSKHNQKTMFIFVLALMFNFPGSSTLLSFNLPNFPSHSPEILLEGDSTIADGAIHLIPTAIYSLFRVGRASYFKLFHLHDSSTGLVSNFVTNFSFTIDIIDLSKLSDGFAFFLAPVSYSIPPNSAGRGFGIFNSSTRRNPIVVVEFDTFSNSFDPPFAHIGIDNGSITSAAYVNWDLRSTSGREGHVLISYNATTKNLSVACSYQANPVYSNVSCIIDLKSVLPEWVKVGFSASSGQYFENKIAINSWRFHSDFDRIDESGRKKLNEKTAVLIAAAGLSLLILTGRMAHLLIKKRRSKVLINCHRNYALVSRDIERVALPRRFTHKELERATNSFADDMRLGQGGSGHVYRGTLSGIFNSVAIKKIPMDFEKLFINEVKVISRLIHRNLVQFIGWCHERGELLLVYEYMANGSLDMYLSGQRKPLPWRVRFRIAIGLASALHYLHEEAEQCVIHRDLKPANVFLDMDFGVKLGNFGVAKLVDPQFRTQATGVVGTWGYMAPEYAYEGKATRESDMYSFGVVALEIACGRNVKDEGLSVPLVKWVWQLYLEGNLIDAADEQLGRDFDMDEMECLLKVGLWCSHSNAKDSLKSGQVIKALRFESCVPELPREMVITMEKNL